ncbi:MAG: thioredoxin domain-containing protein, partial [Candidatus Hydrogenedentes bacterium]|nr:thioredoxin domain-containing protein [Candidatus Hydrogenedentota bacterium]
DVRAGGNFDSHETYHEGLNILHVPRAPETVAKELGMTPETLETTLAACREKLLAVRAQRARPGLDDKILTSWNGMMIGSFAQGYQVLGDDRYRDAAERAANFLLTEMMRDGVLLRSHRKGESRIPGYLDDYAFLAAGLIDLYEATFDLRWLNAADSLVQGMTARFWDAADGGFFFTADGQGDLIARTKPTYDGAEPSGNSMAAWALLRLARLTDNKAYAAKAERILRINQVNMESAPRGFLKMLCALDFYLSPPCEIALVGSPQSSETRTLLDALHGRFVPNKVVALLDPGAPDREAVEQRVPLLEAKPLVNGQAAAYVCENYACKRPSTTAEALLDSLGQ